jgi:hypothetical protein
MDEDSVVSPPPYDPAKLTLSYRHNGDHTSEVPLGKCWSTRMISWSFTYKQFPEDFNDRELGLLSKLGIAIHPNRTDGTSVGVIPKDQAIAVIDYLHRVRGHTFTL